MNELWHSVIALFYCHQKSYGHWTLNSLLIVEIQGFFFLEKYMMVIFFKYDAYCFQDLSSNRMFFLWVVNQWNILDIKLNLKFMWNRVNFHKVDGINHLVLSSEALVGWKLLARAPSIKRTVDRGRKYIVSNQRKWISWQPKICQG